MSAVPDNVLSFRYDRVSEDTGRYDTEQRRPTPGEVSGGERHVRIPYAVFTCPGMSHGAILLYGWLQQHNGDKGCFPSQSVLAEELGGGERSVRRYLAELEAAGFVRAKVRRGIGGGGSFATAYDLYPDGDAPTNRPKDADEPANVAVSRDEPAKNDRRTGQKVQDEPAKNDSPIKDESNPVNQTSVTKDSAPTERRAPRPKAAAKVAVTTPKEPTPAVEATPTEQEHVPRAKRASASPDGFGLVRWLLKEQGGVTLADYRVAADARAADDVSARLGGVEAAREHAMTRLMEARRTTLLWGHVLDDMKRTEAARQRGVVERRPYAGRGGQGGTIASGQAALDRLLEDLGHGHTGDDQGAEDSFGVWPEQRAQDERRPGPGGGRVLEARNGLPVRLVGPSGVAH